MVKIVILDENQVEMDSFDLNDNYDNCSFEKIKNNFDLKDINVKILDKLDYLVGVYSPIKNSNDFSTIFLNKTYLKYSSLNLDEIKGLSISKIFFANDKNKIILNMINEVYNTKKSQKIFIEFYDKSILKRKLNVDISRIDDLLFSIAKDETDYTYLSMEQKTLFERDCNAISIIQNGCFVKCNKKYLELCSENGYDNVIGKKLDYIVSNKNTVEKLYETINKIIDNKMFSYSTSIKINKCDKLKYSFILDCSYVIYEGKPAVMVIHNDVTQEELNKKQVEKENNESLILKTNFDFIQSVSNIGVTNVINGKFIRSPKLYEILETEPSKDDVNKDISWDFIIDSDIPIIKKAYAELHNGKESSDGIIRIRTAKGNLKYLHFYINVNRINNDLNIVSFCQDITNEQLYLKDLRNTLNETLRLEDNLNRIQSVSKTAMGYSDNLYSSKWTPEIFDLLEIDPNEIEDTNNLIERFVIDEDFDVRNRCISLLSPKYPDIKFKQRVITGKGKIKYIKTVMHHEYDENDNLINRVSFNQDITRETIYERKLESALKDKRILLSEVHHRVKNNLQIILSLINLNMNYNKSPEQILANTQDRIYSMALIHEKIYGSTSLSEVNMKDYTESLIKSLFDMYNSDIDFHSNIDSIDLDMEQAIPLGLIINELVNNTIKYAFPHDTKGNMYIGFKKIGKTYIFTFEDDGIGLPDNIDLDNFSNLGLIVVQNLTLQIGGTLSILDCKGTGFRIEFEKEK